MYATFHGIEPSTRSSVSGCDVPAPTSTSSGCWIRQPCEAQKCCSLRIRSWNVTSRPPQFVQDANGPWLPFEVHRYQLPMNELYLPQHFARRTERFDVARSDLPDALEKRSRAARQREIRRVDPLQAQQPALEVARQRFDRSTRQHRLERRRPQPVQLLVDVGFRGPLVDQLGEVMAVAERLRTGRRQRRADRFGVVQPDQVAPLLLEVRQAHFGQWLERGAKPFARLPRIGCNAPLLAAISCQKDHDAVRFAQFVSAKDEGFGRVQRHAVAAYCTFTK